MRIIYLLLLSILISGCAASKATISKNIPSDSEIIIVDKGDDKLGISSDLFTFFQSEGMSPKILQAQDIKKPEAAPETVSGSGFFISSQGHILTNHHVIEGHGEIFNALTENGDTITAKLVHSIPNSDVAVLKANLSDSTYLNLSTQMSGLTGSEILVAGYPLSNTLGTHVRISNGMVNADVGVQDDPTFIQISAPIQPGNSGGPIVDSKFNAIGIATSSLRSVKMLEKYGALPQNVNFGVKIGSILPFLTFDLPKLPALKANSMQSFIKSTVLITPKDGQVKKVKSTNRIGIFYTYSAYWDLFVWQLSSMTITVKNLETGTILGKVVHSGDHPAGKSGALSIALDELRKFLP